MGGDPLPAGSHLSASDYGVPHGHHRDSDRQCPGLLISVFSLSIRTNRLILLGIVTEIILLALIIYTPPGNAIVGTAPIPLSAWLFFIPFAFLLLGLEEVRKFAVRTISASK